MEQSQATPQVKSAARTIELLEYFAANRGLHSLNDVHAALSYPKSSLYVLLRTLVDLDWLETDLTGTLYRIGLRPLLVGTTYLDSDPVVSAARNVLDWLAEQTNETVHLARLDGRDVVYLSNTTFARCRASDADCRRTRPRWVRRSSPSVATRR
jgi:DNA-binding IclR family transcriptional regulator